MILTSPQDRERRFTDVYISDGNYAFIPLNFLVINICIQIYHTRLHETSRAYIAEVSYPQLCVRIYLNIMTLLKYLST